MSLLSPTVQARNLYYAYPPPLPGSGPTEVLRDVSFDIHAGEFVALLGRVGAGKSTLCLALNGLAPHATGGIFRGSVLIDGLDSRQHPVAELAQVAGLVFQDPETQLTQMRVEDEVAFGPENLGVSAAEIGERVGWALDAVGLASYRDRNPAFLSGGEKQRVAIAATLAMRPKLLVLDEPTANLDPSGKAAVFSVLLHLAQERNIAIVLATQDIERAWRYCRRALVLHEGRIALDDTSSAVFEHEDELRALGIGVPQMVELAHRLMKRRGRSYHFAGVSDAVRRLSHELLRVPAVDARPLPQRTEGAPAAPQPVEAAVVIDRLVHTYEDGTEALKAVSLTIPRGQFVILAGPNGSGKTTLAKHFIGLLKPSSGCVHVAGQDTTPLRVAQLARTVGYVFQNPDHQIFAPTVREEIAFGLQMQKLTPAEINRRVAAALQTFALAPMADLPPATLSLGQRRLVTLAAVLATRPALLVLDEPTGGLDWRTRQDLMDHVLRFSAEGGTVVFITHDIRLMAEYGDRIVVLDRGTLVFDGRPAALFADRTVLSRARLTVPPVVRVGQRLAQRNAAWSALRTVRTAEELADVV